MSGYRMGCDPYEQEFKVGTPLEQLKSIMQTHTDNLNDLKQAIRMYTNEQNKFFSTYITTLDSDMVIIKHVIKLLENELGSRGSS